VRGAAAGRRGMMPSVITPAEAAMPTTMKDLGIDRLSVDERIALVQEIWDSVTPDVARRPLSEAKRQELQRRLDDYRDNPKDGIPWEEVKAAALARSRVASGPTVQTRDQFIDYLFCLMDDFDGIGNQWHNQDIYTFFQAMAAWLNDGAGYYRNANPSIDVEQPSWQLFADTLSAASVYEQV
jgi:putative addiction module component (TIGR02574 family)